MAKRKKKLILKKRYWTCEMCGRCYYLDKGAELTDEAEKKMHDLEKSWLNQGEASLCCRDGFEPWRIKEKLK